MKNWVKGLPFSNIFKVCLFPYWHSYRSSSPVWTWKHNGSHNNLILLPIIPPVCIMLILEPHLPPRVRSSLGKPTLLLSMWYLLYLQHLAHRSHLSLAAAASSMATTYLQYLLSHFNQFHIYQHRRRLRQPILFLHRALTLITRLAGPPPRGVKMGWITIVITAVYLMSHDMITISSATIIEFPVTSSLCIYFVVFATSFFRAFGAGYFVMNFWYEFSGFILSSRFFSLFLGLNLLNIYIYICTYISSPTFIQWYLTCPLVSSSPSNS